MKYIRKSSVLAAAAVLACTQLATAMTAEEIVNRRDRNEHLSSARVNSEMTIVSRGREIVKIMKSVIEGDNGLSEFTNPRDRGTKFLKRGDDLFLFFPDAEDIVKISGHMLNRGMMGSDWSYRDVMESDKLTELYEYEILREEEIDGRSCWVLEGLATEDAEVSYYKRISWIDKERFVGLREELYAKSGRLLKEYKVSEMEEIEGRWYPVKAVMEDRLRRDTRTIFEIKSIEFDVDIPDGTFTLENLRR
ncbi:MAG: outer membrane lipoprotein-sorting protein [Elusimicrobiota bacterium]|nr:outer membrane lipoprotein-sorting protein [Elusimicrobiota bacterium]